MSQRNCKYIPSDSSVLLIKLRHFVPDLPQYHSHLECICESAKSQKKSIAHAQINNLGKRHHIVIARHLTSSVS